MKAVAGAIVVLAGAVLFAVGAMADVAASSGPHSYANKAGMLAMVVGGFVGLIGFGVFNAGLRDTRG